jgi:hypothetical protein
MADPEFFIRESECFQASVLRLNAEKCVGEQPCAGHLVRKNLINLLS